MLKRFDAEEPSSSPTPKRRRESTSSSGSGEESESEDERPPKGRSEMLLSQLAMFPSELQNPDSGGESVAAANGKCKTRIKKVLKPDLCKCTRKCYKMVNLKMVIQICLTFWSLSKGAQDCILWSMQNQNVGCANDDSGSESGSDDDSNDDASASSSSSSYQPINTWYIQGWVDSYFVLLDFPVAHRRHPSLPRSLLQTPWYWNLAAGPDPEEFQRGGPEKIWYLSCI